MISVSSAFAFAVEGLAAGRNPIGEGV